MEDVVLHTSVDAAMAARKAAADAGASSMLGVNHTTPDNFLADAWELWGDGRDIVTAQVRSLLLFEVVSEHPTLSSVVTDVRPLAAFVRRYAGTSAFDDAVADAVDFSANEQALFAAIGAYSDRLDDLGLIESGRAARALEPLMPSQVISCDTWLDLPPALRLLVEKASGEQAASIMPPARIEPPEESLETAFMFPAGPAATIPLIKDEIETFCAREGDDVGPTRVAVCAPDPHDAYRALAPHLVSQGFVCALDGTVPFEQTLLGRALDAAHDVVCEDVHWPQAVSDFACNPLSGTGEQTAQRLDATVRADRLMTCDRARDLLREQSRAFEIFEGLFGEDPSAHAVRLVQHVARTVPSPVEMEAACALESLVEQREQLHVRQAPLHVAAHLLVVAASEETAPARADVPRIEFRSLDPGSLARLVTASYDLVIVGDLSDASFKAADSHTAYDAIAERMGLADEALSLDTARAAFACAVHAARERLACVMPLRDDDRDDAFPSFVLNEYASALRRGDEPTDETLFDLPRRIAESARRCGEDAMAACLGRAFSDPDSRIVLDAVHRGRLVELPLIEFLPAVAEDDVRTRVPVLSPSGIETYLECPYRWFVDGRLRPSEIDEGFGSLEKGTFAHEVFAGFFDELARRGARHLGELASDEADALLDDVFDGQFEEDLALPGERLAPVTPSEHVEVETLRRNLHACLRRQRRLPQSYTVFAHELEITPDDVVDYAGVRLNGRADRVDVDEQAGRFVVLDYKGDVKKYAAGFSESDDAGDFALPHKVQALIYARALRSRFDGLRCAGALYLAYRARSDAEAMAGSYDETAYDVSGLSKSSSRVCMNFDAFLDLVEDEVAPSVQALAEGDIRVSPKDKESCRFCSVRACERRLP